MLNKNTAKSGSVRGLPFRSKELVVSTKRICIAFRAFTFDSFLVLSLLSCAVSRSTSTLFFASLFEVEDALALILNSDIKMDAALYNSTIESLTESGVIDSLKAQLRSSIFAALDTQTKLPRKKVDQDSQLALLLAKDLLSSLNLVYSISVLEPECGGVLLNRSEAAESLGLDVNGPALLIQLLNKKPEKVHDEIMISQIEAPLNMDNTETSDHSISPDTSVTHGLDYFENF